MDKQCNDLDLCLEYFDNALCNLRMSKLALQRHKETLNAPEAEPRRTRLRDKAVVAYNLSCALGASGISELQLALASNVPLRQLEKYLRGEACPQSGTLLRLAKALGVKCEDLLTPQED